MRAGISYVPSSPDDALKWHHERARRRGVNPFVYWVVRAVLEPFLRLYFRTRRIGHEHVPSEGPVIVASNHRSFLDPFIVAICIRRPVYFVAKRELFEKRLQGWLLNALGAFPVRRGESDEEMMETATAILRRGDVVVIFPEGTRIRTGSLATPRRGVGRLALETGAPVVPVAITGTEHARRGWRIRPVKVKIRCGRPLTFPRVESASPSLATEVTARIWPCVELQWEWLGGLPPLRKAAVVGAGSMGTAIAALLARSGLEVQLGCRTPTQAERIVARGTNEEYVPKMEIPDGVSARELGEVEFCAMDLVVFAVPAAALPQAVAKVGDQISSRSGVLVLAKGLVPPLGTLPPRYVRQRVKARAVATLGGPCHAEEAVELGASVVIASEDPDFRDQLARSLEDSGVVAGLSDDVTGVALAGCAKNVAAFAASAASSSGMNAAGAAAAEVFAEAWRLSESLGGRSETFSGLAGTGDLVATVLAPHSRNRRAGELIANGVPAQQVEPVVGQTAESVGAVELLVALAARCGVEVPATMALAELVAGRLTPERWVAGVRSAAGSGRRRAA